MDSLVKNILNYFEYQSINQSPLGFLEPYIIAEAGVNHEGSLEIAKKLINDASEGGADAIKFQTYRASMLASKDSPSYWDTTKEPTKSQFELFSKHDKFWKKEFEELKIHCDSAGIEFLSTPFDIISAEFLNDLMPVFKISSSDLTNKPFIQNICSYNKPIILSTGASSIHEIDDALKWVSAFGNKIALLHCILNYPTEDSNANLGMILDLKKQFPENVIGYSDHTLPNEMRNIEIAVLYGARIIEKHFTHDKALIGNDHYHAMDMGDLKKLGSKLSYLKKITGSTRKEFLPSEIISRKNARRSLVAAKTIKKGEQISLEDLTWKRPAAGISPSKIEEVVGCYATREISEDEVIKQKMIEKG
ncbi:MAG: acetylneuraminic acid synthetase [Euryarchaeota archaeon]|nr:acetylneuraminic acid synthetase [Euryarchaeota archaeon]